MGGASQRLLKGRKYDTLRARLSDRLGEGEAATLWARAVHRSDGMLAQFDSLPKDEKPQVEGYMLPTCALYFELTDSFGKDKAIGAPNALAARGLVEWLGEGPSARCRRSHS